MADAPERSKGRPGMTEAALFALCPQCGARTLFAGWTRFAERCRACGLDLTRFNVGDGPAAFLTMVIGAVVVTLALWLQLAGEPPWWLHALLWPPLTVVGVILGLRVAKAALLQAEYRHKLGEQR
jgi:uncharacterized protein (DUF983 family)